AALRLPPAARSALEEEGGDAVRALGAGALGHARGALLPEPGPLVLWRRGGGLARGGEVRERLVRDGNPPRRRRHGRDDPSLARGARALSIEAGRAGEAASVTHARARDRPRHGPRRSPSPRRASARPDDPRAARGRARARASAGR